MTQTYIGNSITEAIVILMAIIMILTSSCSKDDVLRLETEGTVAFTASLIDLKTTKADVPQCSNKEPTAVKYRLINEDGFVYTSTSDITVTNNIITTTDELSFPVGTYTRDEISLFDSDGNITHTVPHQLDTRFSFYNYFDNYLPSIVTISPGVNTSPDFSLVCYTEQEIQYGELGSGLGIDDLETLFYIIDETQNCLTLVTIEIDFDKIQEIPVTTTGLYAIPIPSNHVTWRVQGYDSNGNMRQAFIGSINYDQRILQFQPNCN